MNSRVTFAQPPAPAMPLKPPRYPAWFAITAALALALSSPWAAAAEPDASRMEAAARDLQRGMAGDESAIDTAAKAYEKLLAEHPGDPLVMAYAGASTALRAEATWMPWKKMSYAEDGLALIDKAIALLTPAHAAPRADGSAVALETRFVAASTFLSLPDMFNRRARGERLLKDVQASPQLATASLSLRGAVWLRVGQEAARAGRVDEARRSFQQVIDLKAPQAETARQQLAVLK